MELYEKLESILQNKFKLNNNEMEVTEENGEPVVNAPRRSRRLKVNK